MVYLHSSDRPYICENHLAPQSGSTTTPYTRIGVSASVTICGFPDSLRDRASQATIVQGSQRSSCDRFHGLLATFGLTSDAVGGGSITSASGFAPPAILTSACSSWATPARRLFSSSQL